MCKLSFIATRTHGVEVYHFTDIPHVYVIEPVGRHWLFELNEYATRKEAFIDMIATATYDLERNQRRYK